MMNIDINNPEELQLAGIAVLTEALGPVGYARFMEQMGARYTGDYTKEKYERPEMSFAEIMVGVERMNAEYARFKAAQRSEDKKIFCEVSENGGA